LQPAWQPSTISPQVLQPFDPKPLSLPFKPLVLHAWQDGSTNSPQVLHPLPSRLAQLNFGPQVLQFGFWQGPAESQPPQSIVPGVTTYGFTVATGW